jgi:hypothetical protein
MKTTRKIQQIEMPRIEDRTNRAQHVLEDFATRVVLCLYHLPINVI